MAGARDTTEPESLIEAISTVRRQLRSSSGVRWPGGPLSSAEVDVVRLVRRQPGTSVSEAARTLGVAPNTVSTLVRRLVDCGWVLALRDEADRRVVRLELTPVALRRVQRWRDERTSRVATAWARLTPAQRRALARAAPALEALATALRQESEES